MLGADGTAQHGKITGVDNHRPGVYLAGAGDRTVARRTGSTAVDTGAGGIDARAQLFERIFVQQTIYPLPGGQFAPAVLPFNVRLAAAQKVVFLNVFEPL